jgi:HD-GYP domain-containing protein (c-di-GMP phosphodiesterase class II)
LPDNDQYIRDFRRVVSGGYGPDDKERVLFMSDTSKQAIVKIISEMVTAVTNIHLYPPTHPQVAPLVDHLYNSITLILETTPELTIVIVDEDIVLHGKPLSDAGHVGKSFVKMLQKKGIEHLTLLAGLTKAQLFEFLNDLASIDVKTIADRACIKTGKITFDQEVDQRISDFLAFREMMLSDMQALYYGIRSGKQLDVDDVQSIVTSFINNFQREINPLNLLASLKSEDEYTYVHATNVALLTMSLAEYLGFTGKPLENIGIAALLHDVGKMVIPDEILNKNGALDTDERTVMETHPLRGIQYLATQKDIPTLAMIATMEHHLKYDGTGYPHISDTWRPNIVSQMVSVADVFDALRSKRPYRGPVPQDKIISILRKESGKALNPELVENFITMIEG